MVGRRAQERCGPVSARIERAARMPPSTFATATSMTCPPRYFPLTRVSTSPPYVPPCGFPPSSPRRPPCSPLHHSVHRRMTFSPARMSPPPSTSVPAAPPIQARVIVAVRATSRGRENGEVLNAGRANRVARRTIRGKSLESGPDIDTEMLERRRERNGDFPWIWLSSSLARSGSLSKHLSLGRSTLLPPTRQSRSTHSFHSP
jgi:hypothetical protein